MIARQQKPCQWKEDKTRLLPSIHIHNHFLIQKEYIIHNDFRISDTKFIPSTIIFHAGKVRNNFKWPEAIPPEEND